MFFRFVLSIFIVISSAFAYGQDAASSPAPSPAVSPGPDLSPPTKDTSVNAVPKDEPDAQSEPGTSPEPRKKKKKKHKKEVEQEAEPAVEPTPQPTAPPVPLINRAADYLQGSQEGISDRVIILANDVDLLFGNQRALDEYYNSSLHVTQKFYANSVASGSYDIQTNLNLSLPNWKDTEQRIQRWWNGEESEDQKVTKKEFKELNPWTFNDGIGLRFSRPLAYNLNARVSKDFLIGPVVNHFYEQLSWDSDNLWQEVTSLTNDYALDKKLLFRFLDEADWNISNLQFNSYHGPSLIYTINKVSLTSFDLRLITATENNNFYTDNYTAGITYRTSLHPLDWMFVQITPELSWPRQEHFTSVWTIYVTLDAVFGSRK